jgi:predicted O-methyltransferase YrrM
MPQRPSAPHELRLWSAVDRYFEELLIPAEPSLETAISSSRVAGLPEIQVSPLQGRFLEILARATNSRRILEIGTLAGYSTIWLGKALPPHGRLLSLEIDPAHAKLARENLRRAGLGDIVEVREGPAVANLQRLVAAGEDPFDLVFIDADKTEYADYLEWAFRLSRRGTLIVADNVVRRGDVTDASSSDPNVQGVRRMCELVQKDKRLAGTVLQTTGTKGHGMLLAVVLVEPDARRGTRAEKADA